MRTSSLVLLPGMDGTGELFKPLVRALGPDITTLVVQYPNEPLDYPALTSIATATLPRNGGYVILGESFSGPIAVSIAAEAPCNLLGCILSTSFVRSPRRFAGSLARLLGLVPGVQIPERISTHYLLGTYSTPELREMLSTSIRQVSTSTLRARLNAIANVDVLANLKSIRLPSLYMRAVEDRLVPRSAAMLYAKNALAGTVVELEGPHGLLQVNPEGAAECIRTFMHGL